MIVRPGINAVRLCALCLILACAALALPFLGWLIVPILLGGCVLAVLDALALRRRQRDILVDWELPACVGRGREFDVAITLRNPEPTPVAGELRFVLPGEVEQPVWIIRFTLDAESELTDRRRITLHKRGLYPFGPIWIRLQERRGMIEVQKELPETREIKVYPESMVGEKDLAQDQLAQKSFEQQRMRSRMRGEGTDFESITPYARGDDIRRIDWRSTAKQHALMVRRYQIEQHREVMLLVDCGRLMGTSYENATKLDFAIDSALMLSRVALEHGDRCGVGVFDNQVRGYLPPQSGMQAQKVFVDCLYDVGSEMRDTHFESMFAALQSRQRKRSLIVILSDLLDADTTERFRAAMVSLSRRHVVIFAALKTPLFDAELAKPLHDSVGMARQAVTLRIMQDRARALYSLQRAGISVVDVLPKDLTVPLLNRYIELRASTHL